MAKAELQRRTRRFALRIIRLVEAKIIAPPKLKSLIQETGEILAITV